MASAFLSLLPTIAESDEIFHPLDPLFSELRGTLVPSRQGTWKVNKQRLEKSSEDYPNASETIVSLSQFSLHESLSLPKVIFSAQTYEHGGFTLEIANKLWVTYQKFAEDFPDYGDLQCRDHFLSFAYARIDAVTNPDSYDDGGWWDALEEMGFDYRVQKLHMIEQHRWIRLTETAKFWAKDTVELRMGSLEGVKRDSWERAQQAAGSAQRAGCQERSSIESAFPGLAVEISVDAKEHAPGLTVLWKALELERTVGLFTPENTVDDFTAISSTPPRDFSTAFSSYWAVDKEIAMRYLKWAQERMDEGPSKVALLRLEIPNNLIEPLTPPVLQYPNDDWKELVWSCRRARKKLVPKKLRHYLNQTLIIGHICTGTDTVTKLQDWRDIDHGNTLKRKSDNGIATQYCFGAEDGIDFLNTHCRNSLIMYRPGGEDLQ